MATLLHDDLEDLFAIPWLVDDFCELMQGLEDRSGELTLLQHGFLNQANMFERFLWFDLPFIKSSGEA
ncbi:hypothetical protein A2U01_0091283, partial [Trifolium medium]|nr:hypothetical protein [Trifolium medium]